MRYLVLLILATSPVSLGRAADELTTFTPKPVTAAAKACDHGWRELAGIVQTDMIRSPYRERITSLVAGVSGEVWVGTSTGRVLSMIDDRWTLQAHLQRVQITGIALEGPDRIWLSTSDGIRRLDRSKGRWGSKAFRHYCQGHPAFVSGVYVPGVDSERGWGYVDNIYVPPNDRTYAPLAVSTEHGLFCYGRSYEIWDHFMAHYWGANSPWLDIRELIPHRRPTCIVEDAQRNLWVGTQWDGIVRFNARARDYHRRGPGNRRDGTEFTFLRAADVRSDFDEVADIRASAAGGVWAFLVSGNRHMLARFDGRAWATLLLPEEYNATCFAEVNPEVVYIGTQGILREQPMLEVDWPTRKVGRVPGPNCDVLKMIALRDGRVFAASWSSLYEKRSK